MSKKIKLKPKLNKSANSDWEIVDTSIMQDGGNFKFQNNLQYKENPYAFGGNVMLERYKEGGGVTDKKSTLSKLKKALSLRENLGNLDTEEGYNTPLNQILRTAVGIEGKDYSNESMSSLAREQDAFRMYLGLPSKTGAFEQTGSNKYRIRDYGQLYPETMPSDEAVLYSNKINTAVEMDKSPVDLNKIVDLTPYADILMGTHNVVKGKDDKGEYLKYYDRFDFDPTKHANQFIDKNFNPSVAKYLKKATPVLDKLESAIFNPFELEDKVYYDPKTKLRSDIVLQQNKQKVNPFGSTAIPPELKSGGSISQQGYRDDSPYRNRESIDIHSPNGLIDMSETGMPILANGRYLPPYSGMHQFEPGVVREERIMQSGGMSSTDSVAHQMKKTFEYENLRGGAQGNPISNYGYYSSTLPNFTPPQTINQAVEYAKQEYLPKLKPYSSAMEKGEAFDFMYNSGKDPRVFAYQEYLKKTDPKNKTGWQDKDGKWKDRKTIDEKTLDSLYQTNIGKLPENERRVLMNKGRDFYYQNINNPAPGVPNDAYKNTWYGRIWNTNDFKEFNPNNPNFIPQFKSGGSIPIMQSGGRAPIETENEWEILPEAADGKQIKKSAKNTYRDSMLGVNIPRVPIDPTKQRVDYLYNTLNPNEEDPFEAINYIRYKTGIKRSIPKKDDANQNEAFWKKYLGMPNDVKLSKYKDPKYPNVKEFSKVNELLEDAIFDKYKNINVPDSIVNEGSLPIKEWYTPLGNFTVGKDKDKNGEFVYYRDVYDFPSKIKEDFKVGKDYNIYGKKYLNEFENGGQTSDWEIVSD
jgi:hypothetical protein